MAKKGWFSGRAIRISRNQITDEEEIVLTLYQIHYWWGKADYCWGAVEEKRLEEALDSCDKDGFIYLPETEITRRTVGQIKDIEYYNPKADVIGLTFPEYCQLGCPRALVLKRKEVYRKARPEEIARHKE